MRAGALRALLPVCGLALVFVGTALATAFSAYEPLHGLVVVCVYLALAGALHAWGLFATRLSTPLGLLAAAGTSAVVLWHVREQVPAASMRPLVFAVLTGLLAAAYLPVLLRGRHDFSRGRLFGSALAGSAVFCALVAGSWYGSDTLRWHLLRQNPLIGTPAYYVFAPPIEQVRDRLWAAHTGAPVEASAPSLAAPANAPDIIFLMVDTLRADALAAYGGTGELMPRLDAFADRSWVFDDVLANATWTRPSVASYFTGLPQELHGAVDRFDRLPETRTTLAETLAGRGYATAAFVTNFGAVGVDAGFDQGFEHFQELHPTADAYARASEVNRAVERWLAERPADDSRPLFLYVHYLDPHTPYESGARSGTAREAYDDELRYLDDELTGFVDRLPELLGDEPVLFVTSDHGEEFGEHGDGGHGHSLYPEVAQLPAVLSVPGGGRGRIAARLEARDFFDLLAGPAVESGDVAAWARQRDRARRFASIYSTTSFGPHRPYKAAVAMRGVEVDGWFLIGSAYGSTTELYDRSRDPGLEHNVAARHPDRVARMRRDLEEQIPEWVVRQPVEHSDETEALLEALGYIDRGER